MWQLPYGPKEGLAGGRKEGGAARRIIPFIYVIVYENINIVRGDYYYFHFTNKEQLVENLCHTDKRLVTSTSESKFTPFPL